MCIIIDTRIFTHASLLPRPTYECDPKHKAALYVVVLLCEYIIPKNPAGPSPCITNFLEIPFCDRMGREIDF